MGNPSFTYHRQLIAYAWLFNILILSVARIVHAQIQWQAQSRGVGDNRVLLVGANEVGQMLIQKIDQSPKLGYQVMGFVDAGASNAAIAKIAEENGLVPLPSATNFVTIDCGRDGEFAKRVVAELVARDVFVRMPFVEPGNRCIRISAGLEEDIETVREMLPLALKSAREA